MDAWPMSPPPAVEDEDEATGHHLAKRFAWEIEGIQGNALAGLIEERLDLGLTTVDESTATTTVESEKGSAVPRLKGQVRSRGEEGDARARGLGAAFIGLGGDKDSDGSAGGAG